LNSKLHLELTHRLCDVKFPNIEPLLDLLRSANISFDVGHYKTYVFPPSIADSAHNDVKCFSREDPLVRIFGFGDFAEQVYALERDGRVVSACVSIRENDRCGEAWVYTDEKYRKQGFARQVAGAWAQGMLNADKVPFYSHKIDNMASAGLAKHLGLQPAFEEIAISYSNHE
jgi:RimJ/RimL family protein N-acetyltransferase